MPENDKPGDARGGTIKIEVPAKEDEVIGKSVGRYKILEKVGEGGCGVVYVAEQTEPVRRRVALKVIKLGMDTKAVIARFEAERQALAMMDHPNIAKVLDAGATEQGRPFFVMELVRGIRITDYCDENVLTTEERLDLFIKVCQAIQHAHQKGIIHRDIKPSNILVTLHDGTPVPKVIDFGIAKAAEGRLTEQTVYTQLHQFIGTPAYMSPEQAEMSGLDIDTRSDIYSLGVLLYELLAGRTPFDAEELAAQGLDAMRKAIREREPTRPSTKVAALPDTERTTTAKRRSVDCAKLLHQLKGDLDWIVMKCLEKNRTRRYDTANGLALDLKRHLDNEPVLARPPSAAYKFQKAFHRNKLAYCAAAAVMVALAAGFGLAAAGWRETRVERDKAIRAQAEAETQRKAAQASEQQAQAAELAASREAAKQEAVNHFLNQMFAAADPDALTGPDVTKGASGSVVDMLDEAAKQLEGGALKDRPEIEAAIRQTLGKTYESRGQYEAADTQLKRALELETQVAGPERPATARTLAALAHLRLSQDKLPEAEQLQKEELGIQRKLHAGKEDPDVARALCDLADIHMEEALGSPGTLDQAKLADAESAVREALAMQRRILPAKDRNLARTLVILGRLMIYDDKIAESESMLNEALTMQKELLGPDHPDVAFTMQQLAETKMHEKRFAEGENLCRQAIAIQRKTLGNDHPALATSLLQLGYNLMSDNKPGEAEAPIREALAIRRSALGENNIHVAWCLKILAESLTAQKKLPAAEETYRDELPVWAKARGVDFDGYQEAVRDLVAVLKSEGKTSEIETVLNQTLAAERNALGERSPVAAATLEDIADFLASQGRAAEAHTQYDKVLDIAFTGGVTDWSRVPEMFAQQVSRFADRGEFRDAEMLCDRAIKLAREKLGESDPVVGDLYYMDARLFMREYKWTAAVEELRKALPIRRATLDWKTIDTLRTLGAMLLNAGKFNEVEPYCKEALADNQMVTQQPNFWVAAFPKMTVAWSLYLQGKVSESEQTFRDALKIIATPEGSEDCPRRLRVQANEMLVRILREENKGVEADALENELFATESPTYAASELINIMYQDTNMVRPSDLPGWSNDLARIERQVRPEDFTNLPPQVIYNFLMVGHRDEAERICRKMLDSPAPDALWLADASFIISTTKNPTNRDPALALELAKKAARLLTNNSETSYSLGVAHYRAGDFKQSVLELEETTRLEDSPHAGPCFFLAAAHYKLGETDDARRLYTEGEQWMDEHNPDDRTLGKVRTETEQLLDVK